MPKNLAKTQIAEAIRQHLGVTHQKPIQTIESLIDILKRTLVSGKEGLVSGFGEFGSTRILFK